MKKITSRDNPEFRHLLQLAGMPRTRRAEGNILLDGPHLIEAYVHAFGSDAMSFVVRASSIDAPEVRRWLDPSLPSLVLADGLFNELSPVETPTGIIAVARLPTGQSDSAPGAGLQVFVDGVQDPGNLGAILRSAAAAGAQAVALSAQCADPWSPRCLRGGMGAHFLLSIADHQNLPAAIRRFPGRVLGASAQAEVNLFKVDLTGPVAFAVGAEGKGITPEVLAVCAGLVRIPMAPGVESLNAAAAATLLFYEWRRRGSGRLGNT